MADEKKECLTCVNWKPRESGEMAKHGAAVCALGPAWRFLPLNAVCKRYAAAAPDVREARVKWARRFVR